MIASAATSIKAVDLKTRPSSTVPSQMDAMPLTRLHLAILAVGTLAFAFDLLEFALGYALSAVFSAPPHSVPPGQLSLLLAAVYIGAVIGAPLAGVMADLRGRRLAIAVVLVTLSATSVLGAFAPDITTLIAARFLGGIAIGAYPPLLFSFLTDLMPPRFRGRAIMIVTGLAGLGPVGMLFFVRWLTPIEPLGIEAWRWAFLLGSAGAVFFALAFLLLPESPRWLSARGREAEAQRVVAKFAASRTLFSAVSAKTAAPPTAAVPGEGLDRRRFGFFAAVFFLAPWTVIAFPLLMGPALLQKGFKLGDSLFLVGLTLFGPVIGSTIAAFFLDRVQRRTALATFAVAMIISALCFGIARDMIWLTVAGTGFMISALLYLPTLTIYTAESFPTVWRARTGSGGWAVSRVAAALVPLVMLPVLNTFGIWPMLTIMIGTLLLALAAIVTFGPRGRAGMAVD